MFGTPKGGVPIYGGGGGLTGEKCDLFVYIINI